MENELRCPGCGGSGKIMAGGFIGTIPHDECNGTGKLHKSQDDIMRDTLMQKFPGLPMEDAVKAVKEARETLSVPDVKITKEQLKESYPDVSNENKRKAGRPKKVK